MLLTCDNISCSQSKNTHRAKKMLRIRQANSDVNNQQHKQIAMYIRRSNTKDMSFLLKKCHSIKIFQENGRQQL